VTDAVRVDGMSWHVSLGAVQIGDFTPPLGRPNTNCKTCFSMGTVLGGMRRYVGYARL